MEKKTSITIFFIVLFFASSAQNPLKNYRDAFDTRYDSKQPVINYTLTVDSTDISGFMVEMRVRNVTDTFHVAMVAHPEYDDQYWRYVENFSVDAKKGKGQVIREDSALWKIITKGNEAVLHYKLHLPPSGAQRSAWKAYISATGGLVGGPHSFMYVVGATLAPSYVTLKIPNNWQIATGLEATVDLTTFFAASVAVLIDDPIFIGRFKSWSFSVDGVPHRILYWPLPDAAAFDEARLVADIQKLIEETSGLFGRLPYRDYIFMLQDGAVGALEHNNSVTVGAPSSELSKDISSYLGEIAHEYFHTWNLVRIHPVEYGDVSYKTPPLSKGLWWSEGLTIFYADLLCRRAGLPAFDTTRIQHLETLVRRYFSSSAYRKFSAEEISLASYGPIGMLGDYAGSTHLQGEISGAMLDLIIRDATDGKHSIDDVMRKMMEQFSAEKGFTSTDIEKTITDVCGCSVHSFFENHIRGNKTLEIDKYLALIGLKTDTVWKNVEAADGKANPDLRVYSWVAANDNTIRFGVTDPSGCWVKAGLHTNDIIKTVNGKKIKNAADLRQLIRNAKIGDTVSVEVQKSTGLFKANVVITGYRQPVVHIEEIKNSTEKQERLFKQWLSGN